MLRKLLVAIQAIEKISCLAHGQQKLANDNGDYDPYHGGETPVFPPPVA